LPFIVLFIHCSYVICAFTYRIVELVRRKILDSAVDEVSEALSMHMVPLAIQIVVVPAGVTVLLGLHNPPRSWTGTVAATLVYNEIVFGPPMLCPLRHTRGRRH
jgi:hypothetical protein